mmetsp:Transcript_5013/g.12218  ORF Transcript_5013/g.12218 Transcript_5013/m.12218 type:complete len:203 (-) Transcript_5013:93-701(-)
MVERGHRQRQVPRGARDGGGNARHEGDDRPPHPLPAHREAPQGVQHPPRPDLPSTSRRLPGDPQGQRCVGGAAVLAAGAAVAVVLPHRGAQRARLVAEGRPFRAVRSDGGLPVCGGLWDGSGEAPRAPPEGPPAQHQQCPHLPDGRRRGGIAAGGGLCRAGVAAPEVARGRLPGDVHGGGPDCLGSRRLDRHRSLQHGAAQP